MPEICVVLLTVAELARMGGLPIAVTLRADAEEIRAGDPVLLKVGAVNRSEMALAFRPPLRTLSLNLWYECKPPGEEGFHRVDMLALGRPRAKHPQGFQAAARHVCYDYLFRQRIVHGPNAPRPPGAVPQRYVLSAEGNWEVRAAVVVGGATYRSQPVRIRVRGTHSKLAAEALDACAERLQWWFTFPISHPTESDAALFAKHLPALLDTPAAVPLRRGILLNEVVRAATPQDRKGVAALVREFGAKQSPLQREYTDLLLGAALVKCKDIPAAKALLRDLPEEGSSLRDIIERGVQPEPEK